MATAYYFAAHGAHFPMAQSEEQSTITSATHAPLHAPSQQLHAPPPLPLKTTRADSVISPAPSNLPHSQTQSLFFLLPGELRNQIYTLLLAPNTIPSLSTLASEPKLPLPSPHLHPAILRTCARIHAEAKHLLYTPHVFTAHPALLTSLPHLTDSARPVVCKTVLARITRWTLTLRLDTDPRFSAAQAAQAFSGAEFFELRVWQSMFDGCDAGVLKLFIGVRGVKVARVRGSVEEGLGRWLEGRMMDPVEEWDAEEDGSGRKMEMCGCEGDRYARCEGCEGRVWLERNGAGVWEGEGDAWRFGNR
ncbi:hypothetical protein E8E13_003563 [Curvularia kusanoi]|uniref:Uncharacterized protein n=1 Tax=Curvularia kusanoi TaxID=90978 RepID=A0A9P4TB61_CURKU|nr:hypothetical protein E8E13_003563 [Curvularia kusanoi]